MSIEAMKQALETIVMGENRGATIHAIRQAIEQAEKQEPYWLIAPNGEHYKNPSHPMNRDTPQPQQAEKQEPVAIHCKAKRENNGVCPNHNLQCGWPKCNELPSPVAVISSKQLSAMFQNLKGIDTSQSGYHWRVGWNAALRQAMDYSMPSYTTPQPQHEWVGLTDDAVVSAAARVLSDRVAASCNVDCGDQWMIYGNDFIEDARAALEAAEAKLREKNGGNT